MLPVSPSSASNRLGRSAWVVLLAGMLGSAFMIGATLIAGGLSSRRAGVDLLPAYGVAIGLLIASYVWSLMLAGRALGRGESVRLPVRLFSFALIPLAIYALAHWFPLPLHPLLNCPWFISAFLPVLLPFFALTIPSGTLLVPRIVRNVEQRRADKGLAAWTSKRRRTISAALLLAWVAVLGAVLLPVPVVMYCMVFRRDEGVSYAFDKAIVNRTPDFVLDMSESVLQKIPNSRYHRARRHQLSEGHASVNRLSVRLTDANPQISDAALNGLSTSKRDPRKAAEFAAQSIATAAGRGRNTMQYILAHHGTREQRAAFIEQALTGAATGNVFFQRLEWAASDPELIPPLEKYFRSGCNGHQWALAPLTRWLPEERAEALQKEIVDSNDAAARDFIFDGNCYRGTRENVWSKVLLHSVTHKEAAVRLKAWNAFWLGGPSTAVQADCVRSLLKIMDSNDLAQRRAAAQRIVRGLCIPELTALEQTPWFQKIRNPNMPLDLTQPVENGGTPMTENSGETEAFKSIREAAEKWLNTQSQ